MRFGLRVPADLSSRRTGPCWRWRLRQSGGPSWSVRVSSGTERAKQKLGTAAKTLTRQGASVWVPLLRMPSALEARALLNSPCLGTQCCSAHPPIPFHSERAMTMMDNRNPTHNAITLHRSCGQAEISSAKRPSYHRSKLYHHSTNGSPPPGPSRNSNHHHSPSKASGDSCAGAAAGPCATVTHDPRGVLKCREQLTLGPAWRQRTPSMRSMATVGTQVGTKVVWQ